MLTARLQFSFLAITIIACGSSALAASGMERVPVASKKELKNRVQAMCEAWAKHDGKSAYQLATPDVRRCTPYEDWEKEWEKQFELQGQFQMQLCKIRRIRGASRADVEELKSDCSAERLNVDSAAEVTMKIRFQTASGSRVRINDLINGWLYIGDKWYWYAMGSPSGGH